MEKEENFFPGSGLPLVKGLLHRSTSVNCQIKLQRPRELRVSFS